MHIDLAAIQEAKKFLDRYLKPTPLLFNPWISEAMDAEIYLKLENMQPIGSFKVRGATYKISKLTQSQKDLGVIAASAGNHAQGVAWGSKKLGVNALIVMPTGAPIVKISHTKALGAEIILQGNNYDEAYVCASEIAKKTNRIFVHAFEDEDVIAGQGTLGLELLDQLPDVDYVFGSVGGGGLLAGVSTAIKALRPQVKIVGCQAAKAPSMVESIRMGKAATLASADTFADGIAVVRASEELRKILSVNVDDWLEVEETVIAAAVLTYLEKARMVVEGAGAVPLAAVEKLREKIRGKKVVLVVSGGNIDVNVLSRIIDVGLIRAGRRVRINVWVNDRPGSLARLTDLIAKQGANVLQAIHDRNEPSTQFNQTEVAFTLETSGPNHSASLIETLRENVLRLELAH